MPAEPSSAAPSSATRSPARVRRPLSLALRLTVSIGLAITGLLLLLGSVIERSVEHHFVEQDAEELAVVAQSLQQVLLEPRPAGAAPNPAPTDWQQRLGQAVKGHHGMYYRVADAQGQPLFEMPGPHLAGWMAQAAGSAKGMAPAAPTAAQADNPGHAASPGHGHGGGLDEAHLRVWQEDGQTYRGAVLALRCGQAAPPDATGLAGKPCSAAVATGIGFHEHFLSGFRRTIWLVTSLAGLAAIAITWFAVHQGHAPLRRISAQISGVSASRLHLRLEPGAVPIELQELAFAFNAMLERVEQDFRRLSNFSADIAHELRTPVTSLITQTQVLLGRPRPAEAYREALYSSLEELERMAAMIGDMLFLAQTDNQLIKPARAQVNLADEIQALFDFFEAWAAEAQVSLHCSGETGLSVPGDRLMLRRAFSNLLTNAIRHTAPGGTVSVALSRTDAHTRIRVENPGPPIPAQHLPHLFDRFYRVDPSRQRNGDGAGLGLAIVKSIVDAHGGTVEARCEGERVSVVMELPH